MKTEIENSLFDEDLERPEEEIQAEKTAWRSGSTSQKEESIGQASWNSENFQEDFDEIMEDGSSGCNHQEDQLGDEEGSEVESSSKWRPSPGSPIWSSFNSEGESEIEESSVGRRSSPGTPMISDLGSEGQSDGEEEPVKKPLGSRIEGRLDDEKVSLKGSSGPGRPMGSKNKPKERPVMERRNPVRQKRPRSEEDEDFDIGRIVVDLSPKKKVRKAVEKEKKPVNKRKGKANETKLEELRESFLQREKLNRVFKNLEHDLKAFAKYLTDRGEVRLFFRKYLTSYEFEVFHRMDYRTLFDGWKISTACSNRNPRKCRISWTM